PGNGEGIGGLLLCESLGSGVIVAGAPESVNCGSSLGDCRPADRCGARGDRVAWTWERGEVDRGGGTISPPAVGRIVWRRTRPFRAEGALGMSHHEHSSGGLGRRRFLAAGAAVPTLAGMSLAAVSAQEPKAAAGQAGANEKWGIPGPYPGRVIEVFNPRMIQH